MTDREMIEEMVKITNFTAFDYRQGTIQSKTIYTAMAEALYNADYRKIPEGAVVLDKEEYNKLRAGNYKIESLYKQYPYRVLVGFNSMVFSQDHENYKKLFDDIEKRIAEEIRKETAREIFKFIVADWSWEEGNIISDLRDFIEKRYGVKVE